MLVHIGNLAGRGRAASARSYVPFIVLWGESNTAGPALNSGATSDELAPQPQVHIWNSDVSEFQTLDIGTNNITGHDGTYGNSANYHGFELQLAAAVAADRFEQSEVYLLKTGHGASQVNQWRTDSNWKLTNNGTNPDGTHAFSLTGDGLRMWEIAEARVTAALAEIRAAGKTPVPFIWTSIGLNDEGSSSYYGLTATTDWAGFRTDIEGVISRFRALLGATTPVVLMKFMTPMYVTTNANAQFDAIAADDENVALVDTLDAEHLSGDTRHFSYEGLKLMVERMIDASLGFYGVADAPSISPASGEYASAQAVTITPASGALRTLYTTDGSDPLRGTEYTTALNVTPPGSVYARTIQTGRKSALASVSYTAPALSKWDATNAAGYFTISNGDRSAVKNNGSNGWRTIRGDIGRGSGKRYLEFAAAASGVVNGVAPIFGFAPSSHSATAYIGNASNSAGYGSGNYRTGSGFTKVGTSGTITPVNNSRLQFAIDFSAGKIWLGHNGTWASGGDPAAGTTPDWTFTPGGSLATLYPHMSAYYGDSSEGVWTLQTGASQFTHGPPSGFSAWDS